MMEDPLIKKNNGLNDMSADDGGSSHDETEDGGSSHDETEDEGSVRSDAFTTSLAQYKSYDDFLGLRQRQTQLRSEAAGYGGTSSSAAISNGVETQDLSSRFRDDGEVEINCASGDEALIQFGDDDYLDEVSQMISPSTVIAEARTDCNLNLGTARHTEPISVHGKWKSWSQKMDFEWIFVITNIVLESMSAIFTQLSSKQKPQYALFGMLLSYFALLTCIIELTYEDRRHQQIPIQRRRGTRYYDQPQRRKSLVILNNIVALACALVQCAVTTINYRFENPIKVTVLPIFLAFGVLFSKTIKYRQREAL